MKSKEEIAYDQFKDMEKRYHTWMNYYSLFNGALLVAYCTILVSTGQVIEMGGGISTDNGLTGNARLFQLECTYWNILALISFLGCIASYCWYLSAIGHYHWIERWRKNIKENTNYPELTFKDVRICAKNNRAKHYHSTFKITKFFIVIVLYAWVYVCYSSLFDHDFGLNWNDFLFTSSLLATLIAIEYILHCIIGSDLSDFKDRKKLKCCLCHLCIHTPKWFMKFFFIASIFLSVGYIMYYCCNKSNLKEKDIREITIESNSIKNNDSIKTTINNHHDTISHNPIVNFVHDKSSCTKSH